MFNTVIGVLAIRHAPPGNRVLITSTVNDLVMVTLPFPPVNVSAAMNDLVAVSTMVPPINISNANNDIVAVSQFIPPVQIYVPVVAGFGWSTTDNIVGTQISYNYSNNDSTINVLRKGLSGIYPSCVRATTPITSGKKYFEIKLDAELTQLMWSGGIMGPGALPTSGDWRNMTDSVIFRDSGQVFKNGMSIYVGAFGGMNVGDILGVAVDMTIKTVYFYVNNVLMNTTTFTPTTVYPMSATEDFNLQFTLRSAASAQTYSPPAGFTAAG